MLRTLSGTITLPGGGALQSGILRATPVGTMPSGGGGALAPVPLVFAITDGVIASGPITGGAEYLFEVFDGNLRAVYPDFHGTVADIADPITWGDIYASANTYVPPDAQLADVINNAIAGKAEQTDLDALTELVTSDHAQRIAALESGSALTTEQVQDIVGAMVQAAGDANVAYDDVAGIVTVSADTMTVEEVQDIIGAMTAAGSNVTVTYDDVANTITIAATGGGSSDHGALSGLADDDHPQYHTDARGDARYAPVGHAHGDATGVSAGFMAAADKAKLDGIEAAAIGSASVSALITAAVNALLDGAPGALDTLNELAAAVNDDASFAATVTTALGARVLKAGDTMTGPLVLPGDPTNPLEAAPKQYVDAQAGGGGYTMSAAELEDWRVKAAKMEPGLMKAIYGYESHTIPDGETHVIGFGWNLWRDDAKGPVRSRHFRSAVTGFIEMRGPSTWRGFAIGASSQGHFYRISDATYADPRAEVFRKLGIIRGQKPREARNIGTNGVSFVQLRAGNSGIAALAAWGFDKAWFGWSWELGDGFDSTQVNPDDRRVHQEMRRDDVFPWPIPMSFDGAMALGSGHGFDWTSGKDLDENGIADGLLLEQSAPVNGLDYVHLPLSFHGAGVQRERNAPNGHELCIATVPDPNPPADAVDLTGVTITDPGAGSVTVDADSEWIKFVSSGTDYDTGLSDNARTFVPSAGKSFLCEFTYDAGAKILVGLGDGTGLGIAALTHGITVVAGAVTVYHNGGAAQTSRLWGGTLTAGHNYRLRITFLADGSAIYQLQGTATPTGYIAHAIGATDWWDLRDGVPATTGAGFATLRMKASVGGTAGLSWMWNWPRIALAHDDAPTQPGAVWQHSLLRPMQNSDGYPFQWPRQDLGNGYGNFPDRQGTSLITAVGEQYPCNSAAVASASSTGNLVPAGYTAHGTSSFRFNSGVADMIYEGSCKVLISGGAAINIWFNASSDATQRWNVFLRWSDGACGISAVGGTQDASPASFLGAYPAGAIMRWRVIGRGNNMEVWLTKGDGTWAQIASTTSFANREFKTNTYCGFQCPDQIREWYLVGGFGEFEGLTVRRSQ